MARTAVFGGSFNPIHYGHLLLADEVVEALDLDRILFVPAAVPPHKSPAYLAPAADRYAMIELAVAGHPKFAVSDLELRRAGPSYTVDTLEALRSPLAFSPDGRWLPRVGSAFDPESAAVRKVVREIGEEPRIVRATSLPISASDLRRRVREGRSVAYRLPEAVIRFIQAQRLYRTEGA